MSVALRATRFGTGSRWARHGAVLTLVVVALLVLFADDVGDLVRVWWTSTTYGHCLFIGPVVAWLVWQRRHELAVLRPQPWWPGLGLVAMGGFGWLLGASASVNLVRQLALVVMLQGSVVTLLGPFVTRGLLFPLGYAFFLVPFGQSLEPPLQAATVTMVMPLLHAIGVHAGVDGVLIHADGHWFEIAEACSGSKFVIAMVAFGTLVANLCFWSWRRRAVFLIVSVLVPILANGLRAFGTIWAASAISLQAATGFDHIVFGWIFFGLVMAAVLAIGWRWFDRSPDDPAFDPDRLRGATTRIVDLPLAAVLTLAVAATFPMWSDAIAARHQPLPARIALPEVPGWRRVPLSRTAPWSPYYPNADHYLIGRYSDGQGAPVDLAIAVFGSQREGKELVAFGTGPLREEDRWVRIADLSPIAGGAAMRITEGPVERIVATWYWLDGVTTASAVRLKMETMKVRLLDLPQAAVAVHLSVEGGPAARPSIARFLASAGPIDRIARRAVGVP